MDCTAAAVWISIPRFFRIILRFWEISLSIFGTSLGMASRIVTFVPRAAYTVANSTLMTPPPIMTRLSGTSFIRNRSSLVMTPGRSMPGIGIRSGLEPDASKTSFAFSSSSPSSEATFTSFPGRSVPVPQMISTLFAFNTCSIPWTSCLVVLSLYSSILP